MDIMDPAKLKVVDLRAELTKRGLDPKGNKPVLVERLRVALEEEGSGTQTESKTTLDSEGSDNDSRSVDDTKPIPKTPSRSSRNSSREPVTPVRSSRRRSNSRSSTSRQSPARVTASESNDATQALEPIVEESKSEEKIPTPKKSPSKLTDESSENKLEYTEKAEKHVEDEPEKIIKKVADNISKTPEKNIQDSPKKMLTPEKAVCDLSNKISTPEKKIDSPKKILSPEKSVTESPKKISTPEKIIDKSNKMMSPEKTLSPEKIQTNLQDKTLSPEKIQTNLQDKTLSPEKIQICNKTPEKMPSTPDKSVVKSPMQSPDKQIPSTNENNSDTEQKSENHSDKLVESPNKIKSISDTSNLKSPSPVKSSRFDDIQKSDNPNQELKDKVPTVETQDEPMEQTIEEQEENSSPTKHANEESPRHRDHRRSDRKDDRKRKRSHSPHEEHNSNVPKPEDEPEINSSDVLLSWFDSDLYLNINNKNFTSAEPMEGDGFPYMWAGARASYGFTKDKVFYEVKISKNHSVHLKEDENPNILRLGWSVGGTSLQLGEEELSFCFSSLGKKSVNKEFSDYGSTFAVDDVISCYADFTSEMNVTLSYAINGENKGMAFEIPKESLNGQALYPHILSKNCSFAVNFGQEDKWSSDSVEDFKFVGKVDKEDRILGPQRAEKREDCHVILLCGLPASGKTTWVEKYQSEHKDSFYNVLGISNIIQRMNVLGVPIKEVFKGRYESLLESASRSLNKLLDIAPTRRRNYIIDQSSNVYASAQRRKMRNFNGFQRKAIVIVPSDEEFKDRIKKRKESDENFQESSILEMKAGFCAPVLGESFESVEYVELNEEEAKKIIETYNEEGKSAGYGPNQPHHKRHRYDSKDRNHRDKRYGYNDRNRNSNNWRGWKDRRGGSRHGGAPYSPYGRGNRSGGSDRRSGNDRSRSSSNRNSGWNSGYQGSHHSYQQPSNWQGSTWGNSYSQGQYGSSGNWKSYGQNYPSGYSSSQPGYGNGNYGYHSQSSYYNQPYYSQSSGKNSSSSNQGASKK